jgi:Zn-dependent M16 (insulinase) family peptidase
MNTNSNTVVHPAFEILRKKRINSLDIEVFEFQHKKTGAQHIHISAENTENVFLVALRTVPTDSTGVAHILEHTALCGSENYQVRDPFFMMIRRSLNTFMNAFTSSDWTAYPFASQNKKDFNNLLDVYLDAVFFSRLDELDFAQEGHRIEFKDPENIESELVFKGVVFNEMKGAMGSITSTIWQTLCKHLYPTTTYRFNSGGDPACIPDLTHEQLIEFYRTHYHPSNAIFMTFGDIPVDELQKRFENQVLHKFDALDEKISVPYEKRFLKPIAIQENYALNDERGSKNKTHIIMSWLLGSTTNLKENLEAQLLSSVLLDNSASPLQKALEVTHLGSSPSPLCGLNDSQLELCFVCGIEGSSAESSDALESLVLSILEDIVQNGIPQSELEASLHQLELNQREIGGDGYPYGLQLILTALTNATHRGDPIALLDVEEALGQLQKNIEDPNYIKHLTSRLLLKNNHRVRLTLIPDNKMAKINDAVEAERLATIKNNLDKEGKQALINKSLELIKRQSNVDDESILPKVGLEDIPEKMAATPNKTDHDGSPSLNLYDSGTNGLIYQQVIVDLPKLTCEQINLLPIYSRGLTELGIDGRSYLDTQRWQSQVSGGISAHVSAKGSLNHVESLSGHLTISTKGLVKNQAALKDLIQATLEKPRFDELSRIKEIIEQKQARQETVITGIGQKLAMVAASRGISPTGKLAHQWEGLGSIIETKRLNNETTKKQFLVNLGDKLSELHQMILLMPRKHLIIGEAEKFHNNTSIASKFYNERGSQKLKAFVCNHEKHKILEFWELNTPVNFCAKSYPTVSINHPDAAPLTVLGEFLRNGYLHGAIRERGGAYGGGALQDNNVSSFKFFSYRDPRLEETLKDFDSSIGWLKNSAHKDNQVEEAILGVISSIDKPSSPAGQVIQTFHAEIYGRTQKILELFRSRVTEVTSSDLRRVTEKYLVEANSNIAVVSNKQNLAIADRMNLSIMTL